MTPITNEISDLFRKWGIDPEAHSQLVHDLVMYVYDEKIAVVGQITRGQTRQNT